MNVDSILNFRKDSEEDFYALLGCDPSASPEQITAEYKARVKDCHPDKNRADPASQEKFQKLLRVSTTLFIRNPYFRYNVSIEKAKESLCDPRERKMYDDWRSAGIAMSYGQWRALKDSVKTSMHWATPKTSGRMLDMNNDELLSLNPSPIKEEDLIEDQELNEITENDQFFEPTPYDKIPFRMATPPFEEWATPSPSSTKTLPMTNEENKTTPSDQVTMRRRQFAVRRQSTIGAMVMTERWDDGDIRRRFRNYEI